MNQSNPEVIGYMGGFILPKKLIDITEASPATRARAAALIAVEMEPESDVELRTLIES